MNPLEAIQTGVTRQDIADPNGRVLTPQHKLDVMDMLRAYTVERRLRGLRRDGIPAR